MNFLPSPPSVEFTPEQLDVFKDSSEAIASWVLFLKALGFCTETVMNYVIMDNQDRGDYYVTEHMVHIDLTPEDGVDEQLLFFGTSYANLYQFLEQKMWPDAFGDGANQPIYLSVAFFLNDRATITLSGSDGEPLFDNERYMLNHHGTEYTWKEAAETLVAIRKEMLRNLRLEKPPLSWFKKLKQAFRKFVRDFNEISHYGD